jgi:hypothetical protein
MAPIIVTTLNASYSHAAFGLRYLYANLGDLQPQCRLLEYTIRNRAAEIVEQLLAQFWRLYLECGRNFRRFSHTETSRS